MRVQTTGSNPYENSGEGQVKKHVEHPPHYTSHPSGIECIEITRHHNFCIGNVIKYCWRQGLKDGEASITALLKARQYLDFEIERIRRAQEIDDCGYKP